jgi:hypothetical protein
MTAASSNPGKLKKFWRKYRAKSFLILLLPVIGFGIWGYHLESESLSPSQLSSGQIFVNVYVTTVPANVSLTAYSYLNPQQDTVSVSVTGPKAAKDPWILVVQCPPGVRPTSATPLYSESAAGKQVLGYVIVSNHNKKTFSGPLGCFKKSSAPKTFPGQNIDVTLPVLDQNPSAQASPTETPLFVERRTSGQRQIEDLVEVLQPPDSVCPNPGSTSGPQSSPATPSPSSGICYSQVAAGTRRTKYLFPSSVTTAETLENVDLSAYNTPSMFPPGQITSDGKVKWLGLGPLSPSLSATSQASARKSSIDNFAAGLVLGLCGGFLVPFIQGFLPSEPATDTPATDTPATDTPEKGEPARKPTQPQDPDLLEPQA